MVATLSFSTFIITLVLSSYLDCCSANPAYSNEGLLWYPAEAGGYVPALLTGNPKVVRADEDTVHFLLFTLKNQNSAREVYINDKTGLLNAGYVAGAPLYLLTHGFSSGPNGGPTNLFKTEFFRGNQNVNIISIDWSDLAAAPWYERAADATKLVGEKTGKLVNFLKAEGLVSLNNVHFAGHSLGAHVGGYFGSYVGSGTVGRITALDPALPLFWLKEDKDRIDPTDAAFVDVIHTAGGSFFGLAFIEPRGHVDFYPNGGSYQPGCGIDAFGACSHGRCNNYMAESINNPNAFLACKCNSWDEFNKGQCVCNESVHMGLHVPKTARGMFYLKTRSGSPWSL